MGWLDDLETRAKSSIQNATKDIYSWVGSVATDPVVKQGAAGTGNLSAAQIAAGAHGGPAGVAAPASAGNPAVNNAVSASGFLGQATQYAPWILAAAAVAFILGKRKG
jgi:hypothetical protein